MLSSFRFISSFCILAARLSIGFWVGGAILFVITSVAEQRHPQFDSVIRDQLATIRFPLYYVYAWCCLGTTLGATAIGAMLSGGRLRKRMLIVFGLTLLSAIIAIADYTLVYGPLQELITPPGQARNQQFIMLHDRSRIINEVHLSIALIAAIITCLPDRSLND